MDREKTQIVLDADVLIHFSKGDRLALLPTILPEYEYVVLSKVYDEIGSKEPIGQSDSLFEKYT